MTLNYSPSEIYPHPSLKLGAEAESEDFGFGVVDKQVVNSELSVKLPNWGEHCLQICEYLSQGERLVMRR